VILRAILRASALLIVAALIGAGAGTVTAKIDAAIDNYAAGASTRQF
jgi:hypothetical protein